MARIFQHSIVPGQEYLLDGKVKVKVIKVVGRSAAQFGVELSGQRIEIVERERLHQPPIQEGDVFKNDKS